MRHITRLLTSPITAGLFILAIAAGWKALLLITDSVPFNADEAVVALMARHILQGERPIFFYGQAYMGSLDSFLVAGGFMLFGQQVWVIRLVQALLYLGLIISTIDLGKVALGDRKVGLLAGTLMAIPTVNVTLYTTASLGGYGEALLIGNLILLTTIRIANIESSGTRGLFYRLLWFLLGVEAGFGLWANGLTLIYSAPSLLLLTVYHIRNRKGIAWNNIILNIGLGLVGFLLGAIPWWIYALSQGLPSLVNELFGSAVAVEQTSWLQRTLDHMVNFILLGGTAALGLRPPWEIRWLGLPLLPFILSAWTVIIVYALAQLRRGLAIGWGRWLLFGVVATLSAGFILTSFGVDPSGRYFMPFAVPLCLAAGEASCRLVSKPIWRGIVIGLIILFQGWGTAECAMRNPPGITTQFSAITQVDTRYQSELLAFLRSEDETRGYTNYWVAYPTAFLSREEIILAPRLPYHEDLRYTSRDDRYRLYDQIVAQSPKVAFITTLNPSLDELILDGLSKNQATWQEQRIGDYHIFYNLSKPLQPEELGLLP